jgi:hypothetical protein
MHFKFQIVELYKFCKKAPLLLASSIDIDGKHYYLNHFIYLVNLGQLEVHF